MSIIFYGYFINNKFQKRLIYGNVLATKPLSH